MSPLSDKLPAYKQPGSKSSPDLLAGIISSLIDMLPAYLHASSMSILIDMLPAYGHASSMSSITDMLPAYEHAGSMSSLIDMQFSKVCSAMASEIANLYQFVVHIDKMPKKSYATTPS